MDKRIVFITVNNGIDGRDKSRVTFASFNPLENCSKYERNEEQIVDVNQARKKAMAKLDGIDKLVLDLDSETTPDKNSTDFKKAFQESLLRLVLMCNDETSMKQMKTEIWAINSTYFT